MAYMTQPEPSTAELVARWRERADDLERRAKIIRADGDPEYAEDLEQAARDNRDAADRLEALL